MLFCFFSYRNPFSWQHCSNALCWQIKGICFLNNSCLAWTVKYSYKLTVVQVQCFKLKSSFPCQWQSCLPKESGKSLGKETKHSCWFQEVLPGLSRTQTSNRILGGQQQKILFVFMQWAYRRGEWQQTSSCGIESFLAWIFWASVNLQRTSAHQSPTVLSEYHQCSGSVSLGSQCLGSFSSNGELKCHPEYFSVVRHCPDHWPALWSGHCFWL